MGSLTSWVHTVTGGYWVIQVHDLLVVVRPSDQLVWGLNPGIVACLLHLIVGKMTAPCLSFPNLCSSSIAMRRWPDCEAC